MIWVYFIGQIYANCALLKGETGELRFIYLPLRNDRIKVLPGVISLIGTGGVIHPYFQTRILVKTRVFGHAFEREHSIPSS
jgi:hypothetical protein